MTNIQRSLLWVAVALQAGCMSSAPVRPQSYPVPAPSVFASLTCEELAYKLNGYQQLLRNVAVDHPTDAQLYAPMYHANAQGLSNTLTLRNCPASGQTSTAPPTPASSISYCFAYYTKRDLMEPANTTTGVISQLWQAGVIANAPARVALPEFQAYLISRGSNEQLGPLSCDTLSQTQNCTVSKTDSGSFSHGVQQASVMCGTSREAIDKGWAYVRGAGPLLQVVEWAPAQRNVPVLGTPTLSESGLAMTPVTTQSAIPTPAVAKQSAIPTAAMYCTALLSTQHTYGATMSPVKLIAGAANDIRPSLKSYIEKAKRDQPGVWGDFNLNTATCTPGAVVCMAEAKGPTGKTQNAFQFCHATQAKADAELNQMRQGDPQAIVVDWP